ncbi:MAG: prepilin-type N-terminal cleavage/methylation domain-containing protein [Candidatus Eisenbacteria bacterium]|nr:prepilin-type N-terminal cleavage/methylation domain-containing protein [Candidatus Eisenbacteria bacterium]
MKQTESGFTLIELMIVVVIIGILAAIAIPNFISMQDRAREGAVKSNMHTLQMGVEDFSILNEGLYPDGGAGDGATVESLLSGTVVPLNPFSGAATTIAWGSAATTQGDLGYQVPALNQYDISGYGEGALLGLTLSNH